LLGPTGPTGPQGLAGDNLQAVTTAGNTTTNSVIINNNLSIRAASTGSLATQIPVFTASPFSTTRTIVTRTPSQLRVDIGAAPLLGYQAVSTTLFEEAGAYSFSLTFPVLPKHFYLDISYEGPGVDGSNLQRASTNQTHYAKGVRSSTSNLADLTSELSVSSANKNLFLFTDMGLF
jgi:hypothetical protein